jgi:hypothetical protein
MFAVFLVITAAIIGGELGENRLFLPMPSMEVCEFIAQQAQVEEDSKMVYGTACVNSEEITAMLETEQ